MVQQPLNGQRCSCRVLEFCVVMEKNRTCVLSGFGRPCERHVVNYPPSLYPDGCCIRCLAPAVVSVVDCACCRFGRQPKSPLSRLTMLLTQSHGGPSPGHSRSWRSSLGADGCRPSTPKEVSWWPRSWPTTKREGCCWRVFTDKRPPRCVTATLTLGVEYSLVPECYSIVSHQAGGASATSRSLVCRWQVARVRLHVWR